MDNIPLLFEETSFGTILLDEVGDLSQKAQLKLVRVIDSFSKNSPRLISTSQHNLLQLMEQGVFRKDLYFRLNGITISVPPLRKRLGDIDPVSYTHLTLPTKA